MEFYIKRPDCKLYCRAEGKGPLLLLVHGVACDSDYFRETARLLAKKYTVVTYDRRGYTRSQFINAELGNESVLDDSNALSVKKPDFSMEIQVEDAASVIRYMNMGAAYVVGSSAGAVLSAALALRFPELVRALVLHEPVFAEDPQTADGLQKLTDKIIVCRTQKRGITRALMTFVEAMDGADSRAVSKTLAEQARSLKNLQLFVDYEVEHLLQLSLKEAADIQCPVYVAAGECDSNGLFCRGAKSAAEQLGWPLIHVPGYHNMASDLPLDFAVMVIGVLGIQ